MSTFVHLIIFLILLVILVPTLQAYKKIKGSSWFIYARSGHALLLGMIAILFSLLHLSLAWFSLLSATTLIVTGFGLLILMFLFSFENKQFLFSPFRAWLFIFLSHLLMGIIGIWFIVTARPTLQDVFISWIFLILYFVFMHNKVDIPWILYKQSKVPKYMRKRIILFLLFLSYISMPYLFNILS